MRTVYDTMFWVSYSLNASGPRHRLIARSLRHRVRVFISEAILRELSTTLQQDFGKSKRFAALAVAAIRRRTRFVRLPEVVPAFTASNPKDNAVIYTALRANAHYLVTADKALLALKRIRSLRIVSFEEYAHLLSIPPGRA